MTSRLDGQVAIVTGSAHGLGRSHAMALAARGAKVVVDDLGGATDGTGRSSQAALATATAIRDAGGEAMASGANVAVLAEVEAMVAETLEKWGRVDILVNNAGILRDRTFAKMTMEDFRAVVDVHLFGAVHCTKAVWEIMRRQSYGRIVFTASSSGLYGNFGQSNYSAAKMAMIGLMNTLHLEGRKHGIHVNTLSPCAATRMTEDLIPSAALELLTPSSVTAGLLYLVGKDAPSRQILVAGAGTYARTRIYETEGIYLSPDDRTPENVAARWDGVSDERGMREMGMASDQTLKFLKNAATALGVSLNA